MPSRERDWKAEYQRRKALAKKRGLSTAQARGHAKPQEVPVSELKAKGLIRETNKSVEVRYRQALRQMARGLSLTQAAGKAGISRSTILKLNKEREALEWDASARRYKTAEVSGFHVPTKEGRFYEDVKFDKLARSVLGRYWNAVNKGLASGDRSALKAFRGKVVYDLKGNRYRLLADINDVRAMLDQQSDEEVTNFEEKFYRAMQYAP